MMDQDNITWTGARAPGVERRRSLAWRCSTEQVASGSERRIHAAAESTKDGGKLDLATGMLGGSSRQGRSLAGCKSPHRQLPVFGRLAYPMRGEATNRVLLGRKSPGCPAGVVAAVDTVIAV